MSRRGLRLQMRKLTRAERREVELRERNHRIRLEEQGYRTRTLVDETGCFAIVMVEDAKSGRTGLLLPDGRVRWTDESLGLGSLSDAAVSGVTVREN